MLTSADISKTAHRHLRHNLRNCCFFTDKVKYVCLLWCLNDSLGFACQKFWNWSIRSPQPATAKQLLWLQHNPSGHFWPSLKVPVFSQAEFVIPSVWQQFLPWNSSLIKEKSLSHSFFQFSLSLPPHLLLLWKDKSVILCTLMFLHLCIQSWHRKVLRVATVNAVS